MTAPIFRIAELISLMTLFQTKNLGLQKHFNNLPHRSDNKASLDINGIFEIDRKVKSCHNRFNRNNKKLKIILGNIYPKQKCQLLRKQISNQITETLTVFSSGLSLVFNGFVKKNIFERNNKQSWSLSMLASLAHCTLEINQIFQGNYFSNLYV